MVTRGPRKLDGLFFGITEDSGRHCVVRVKARGRRVSQWWHRPPEKKYDQALIGAMAAADFLVASAGGSLGDGYFPWR